MRSALVACLSVAILAGCQTTPAGETVVSDQPTFEGVKPPTFVTAICGECHAVAVGTISPNPEAPGFADIANSSGVTRDTLIEFLSDAHNYPMQMDVDLVQEDIDLIADYMLTLQSEEYRRLPS